MKTMSLEELNSILSVGHDKLLSLVPFEGERHASVYKNIQEFNSNWCRVLLCLAKCDSKSYQRANKFDWDYDLGLRPLAKLYLAQSGRCAITGMIMSPDTGYYDDKNPYKISVDRINNNRGYTLDNVRLLCHWTNNAKSTWSDNVFNEFVESIQKKNEVLV